MFGESRDIYSGSGVFLGFSDQKDNIAYNRKVIMTLLEIPTS